MSQASGKADRERRGTGRNTHLLDIVVAQRAAVFELLAGEDQSLLVRRDALLVLDLGFDIVDRVRGFDLERDGLAREGLDEAVVCVCVRSCLPEFVSPNFQRPRGRMGRGALGAMLGKELTSALDDGQ
jgi:hypothetical protein